MTNLVILPLCVISWTVTLIKLRRLIHPQDQQKTQGQNALNLWAMLFCFSLTLTLMDDAFAALLDGFTLPNFFLLVKHIAFLASQYFALVTILSVIGAPASRRTIRAISVILCLVCVMLLIIYAGFLATMPEQLSESPQNIQIVVFKLLSYPFGILLCLAIIRSILAYLPAKEQALMRMRTITILWCVSTATAYIFVRMLIYMGFFWPVFLSPWLVTISQLLLFCAAILFFATLLSNKIYTRFVLLLKTIEAWRIFQDLRSLAQHMLLFCPPVGLPPSSPGFIVFLFNPDYYLYRTLISILDSKALLNGLIKKESATWNNHQLQEVLRINAALQHANPGNDFAEIIITYQNISRELFSGQTL